MTATNDEVVVNFKLREVLAERHPTWRVGAEQRGVLILETSGKAKKPDLVVDRQGRGMAVLIETEFVPARTVVPDARGRLGWQIEGTGESIEQVMAIRLPQKLQRVSQHLLGSAILEETFEFCVLTGTSGSDFVRWPEKEWIRGGVELLARCIEIASLSESLVASGVEILERGIAQMEGFLSLRTTDKYLQRFEEILQQASGRQTTRMAMAILTNAVIFQERVARLHPKIKSLSDLNATIKGRRISVLDVRDCWEDILEINYWPIFSLGIKLLSGLEACVQGEIVERLLKINQELSRLGTRDIQRLSGRMFQRLISDRKFLATFYTLPSSATLLAELAVNRLGVDWASKKEVAGLRIADFACGTGALLGAVYEAVAAKYRQTGKNDAGLHARVMEDVMYAADIMPAATHLTATTLSSMHPGQTYSNTHVLTMSYGADGRNVSIGSLDLLGDGSEVRPIFGTGRTALSGSEEGIEDEGKDHTAELRSRIEVPDESMDLVIMNPPFTRPTNHESAEVPVPSFAGFGTSKKEQACMSERLKALIRRLPERAGHGNAGLASNFFDLGHVKLRRGGVLALVLPAAFAAGSSWLNARRLLTRWYKDIVIVTIAAHGSTDRAFSADTGMAEVLVLATRKQDPRESTGKVMVTNLHRRPTTLLEALILADTIGRNRTVNANETGKLDCGTGSFLKVPFDLMGRAAGIANPSIAKTMFALEKRELLLPRSRKVVSLPLTQLDEIGVRGAVCRDINGDGGRGPFDIEKAVKGTMTWPALWSHDAGRERSFQVEPDAQGVVRPQCEPRARKLWEATASRLHFNLDFRINSQPLGACLTSKKTLGGRAWPNYRLEQEAWEIPVLLWANTTLGLMYFWWIGSRQQQGRAILSISRHPELLSLDPRKLTKKQFRKCDEIYESFRIKTLLPANEAWRDPVRKELDHAVLIEVLGVDETLLENMDVLRRQWGEEPSVHGGKAGQGKSG